MRDKRNFGAENRGRFQSIYNWFVSDGTDENEASRLFDETNEIIRKITRYAARITEKNASGANRENTESSRIIFTMQ